MKSQIRLTLILVLLAAGFVSLDYAYCIQEPVITVTPYSFPAGIINVVRYSETPLAPFKNLVEEEYPLLHLNYTVQNDGRLEMTRIIINGTIPVIQVNEENTYLTKQIFFSEQVFKGELYNLVIFPQEHINYTQSVEVSTGPLLIYELYNWDEMIGEIIFKETPRKEINTTLTWTPDNLIEKQIIVFSVEDYDSRYLSVQWTLTGNGVALEEKGSHFVTPQLDSGEYNISVYIKDNYGYEKYSVQKIFVEPEKNSILFDPSNSILDLFDIEHPSIVEPNSIQNITLLLNYSLPVSREVKVSLYDSSTGEPLSTLHDNLMGQDIIQYTMFFESKEATMSLIAQAEFLHEDEWISTGNNILFALPVATPYVKNTVPSFSSLNIIIGLVLIIIIRKNSPKSLFR